MTARVMRTGLDLTKPIPPQLYGILRQRIVDNTLEPGEQISEACLAQEFDVSRTPLRAALQQLAADGLVCPCARRSAHWWPVWILDN